MSDASEGSLIQNLRAATRERHDRLDKSIMAAAAFETLAGYGQFAQVQYLFHRDVDGLYSQPPLAALLPDLADRRRLDLIAADLRDLDLAPPEDDAPPVFSAGGTLDVPTALGWLYVAEGSTLGAALLRREATKLGLSDTHGARHLAPAPEGPAARWRAFTEALDAVELSGDERKLAAIGAQAAFARVQALVDARLA